MLFSRQNILLSCKTERRDEMYAGKECKDGINWKKVAGDLTELPSRRALKEWVCISGPACTATNRRDADVQSHTGWELAAT